MGSDAKEMKGTRREKFFYGLGDIGNNLVWGITTGFLTLYYTDSAGMSAAFVGTMMLICRLFDGVSDLAMGAIIDKTRLRWGRARSWILISAIPLALVYIATFNVPSSLSSTGRNIYAFATYFLLSVVFYTATNLAYNALLVRFSLTSQDRSVASVVRAMMIMASGVILNVLTPILLTKLGGEHEQRAWTTIITVYGILSVICLFICFFGVKEKLPVYSGTETKENRQKTPLMPGIKALLSSRYFYIVVFLFLAYYTTSGTGGVGIYYARDVLGNATLFGVNTVVMILPSIIIMPLVPMLFKKFGKRKTMMGGMLLSIAANLIMLINPRNAVLYIGLGLFRTAGNMPLVVAMNTLAGDIVDYNDMRYGIRAEGIATAANSVGMKLGSGFGSALLGWLLAWGHYNGAATMQPETAINAMIFLSIVVPIIIFSVAFILLGFWNLEKYEPEVQAYLQSKRAAIENSNQEL